MSNTAAQPVDIQLVVSVDDHLVEPFGIFAGRLPQRFADAAPTVADSGGRQAWVFAGKEIAGVALNAVAGLDAEHWRIEPERLDDVRRGCWDVHARVADMDTDGVWASLNFPSSLPGFCGARFWEPGDIELATALTRAWNSWHLEEWAGAYPDRLIPLQLSLLGDPVAAAAEIRANSERGFRAVSFCEDPSKHGLPSVASGEWDPFLAACEETQTVICLHVGSSGPTSTPPPPPGTPTLEFRASLFTVSALVATVGWLWSGALYRFPRLQIAMSEGGIGWVPMLLDRLDYIAHHALRGSAVWPDRELSPSDVIRRNFWFCTLDDPSTFPLRDRIGVDRIMVEVDYPHSDSTWPDTRASLARMLRGCSPDEVARMTHANAAELYRHPLPANLTERSSA
jgi:predicted TIM-barrel fold metal-dependent hydrolase